MAVGMSSTSPTVAVGPRYRQKAPPSLRNLLSSSMACSLSRWRTRLKPLECRPLEQMPIEGVAVLDEVRPPQLVALRDADGEARHVEVAAGELPGVLGGLAAEQHALGLQAALVDARDDLGDLLGHDLADDQVVEEERGAAPQAETSLTLIATRSMPIVSSLPTARAISILVPTPSVPATSTGSLSFGRPIAPPKPPSPPSTSGCWVLLRRRFSRSTAMLPASTSTPAFLYVNPCSSLIRSPRRRFRQVYAGPPVAGQRRQRSKPRSVCRTRSSAAPPARSRRGGTA